MYYQNRKAVARSFLILMLLAILSLTIIIYAMNQFFTRANQAVDEPACRASMLARVKSTLKLGVVKLNPFPIICKTQEKVLEGDKEQVMMQISDLSARCWWMFLNGEYENIFDSFDLTSQKKCFICYTFNIDDKNVKINGKELKNYMGENYYIIPTDEESKEEGVTYLDYIQVYKGSGIVFISDDINFVKGEIYALYFISPDLAWGDWFANRITRFDLFIPRDTIEANEQLKKMNMIYIENIGAQGNLDCTTLKSV